MPDVEIIDVETHTLGFHEASARLAGIEAALADMHGPLKDIVADIHRQTLAAFASEGRAIGEGWAALDPSTVAQKAAGGDLFPDWPLVASGAMMDSATSSSGPFSVGETLAHEAWLSLDWENDGWNIPLLHQEGVPWETVTQHRRHQDGTPYTVSYLWHLPARPFWRATDELADEGIDRIAVHIFNPMVA